MPLRFVIEDEDVPRIDKIRKTLGVQTNEEAIEIALLCYERLLNLRSQGHTQVMAHNPRNGTRVPVMLKSID